MGKQSGLRQRKKADSATKQQPVAQARVPPAAGEETLGQVFYKHPLVRVTPLVLIPYFIYHSLFFLRLSRPDILTGASFGLVKFRPAMLPSEPKQVLILGAEVAENRYVTGGLSQSLKLEIVHEAFDPQNYFCRDGVVSWFQIMRFLEPLAAAKTDKQKQQFDTWSELCIDRQTNLVELFHPNQYQETECNQWNSWGPCWSKECLSLVQQVWGCEWNDKVECPQAFVQILHQVRHPMRSLELLQSNLCPLDGSHSGFYASFLKLISGWFPDRQWSSFSCEESMAWYLIDFHNTLLKARDAGLVHGMFQVESTPPCGVAQLAGFLDEQTALYTGNVRTNIQTCEMEIGDNDAQLPGTFTKVRKKNGPSEKGIKKIVLDDLKGGREGELAMAMEALISNLGYDSDADAEFA